MVQNSYSKAVENCDMAPPNFNGQQGAHVQWVEKLHQSFGGCDPAYKKADEAHMFFSTLPPWLKAIITTRVAEGTQHPRTVPTLKELWDFLEHNFQNMAPLGLIKDHGSSPPVW